MDNESSLHVVINALSAKPGGGYSYAYQQAQALASLRGGATYTVLVAPWNEQLFASNRPRFRIHLVNVRSTAARFAYEQTFLLHRVRRLGADILYCPGNFSPILRLSRRPHILLALQNPNYHGAGRQHSHNRSLRRRAKIALSHLSIRAADRVLLISHSLEQSFLEDFVSPRIREKSFVLQSGHPTWPHGDACPKTSLPSRYFLSLANDYPHKRLADVVTAWSRAASIADRYFPDLVLVGDISDQHRTDYLRALSFNHRNRVHFIGQLTSRLEVRAIIEGATAIISASSLEAFPLVPVEAGSLGTPAVLSDIPPHREVTAGRGHFFSLDDPETLVEALLKAVTVSRQGPWTWHLDWNAHAEALEREFRVLVSR